LRFSQRCWWQCKSSGTKRRVDWQLLSSRKRVVPSPAGSSSPRRVICRNPLKFTRGSMCAPWMSVLFLPISAVTLLYQLQQSHFTFVRVRRLDCDTWCVRCDTWWNLKCFYTSLGISFPQLLCYTKHIKSQSPQSIWDIFVERRMLYNIRKIMIISTYCIKNNFMPKKKWFRYQSNYAIKLLNGKTTKTLFVYAW